MSVCGVMDDGGFRPQESLVRSSVELLVSNVVHDGRGCGSGEIS